MTEETKVPAAAPTTTTPEPVEHKTVTPEGTEPKTDGHEEEEEDEKETAV